MDPQETQFGKYIIKSELGRGGFGTVFRAIDTALDRPVALKILDPLLMRDRNWVARFRREAKLMARLDHPNIVQIYDSGTEDGRLFLAMKVIEGSDLAVHIKEHGPFSWDDTLKIVEQMADALDYAHQEGLIHRDLKPSNILLAGDNAVLTDFGLSMLAGANSMSVSLTGGIVGTPSYIPPEGWEGKEVTAQADQYALASLIVEMLTGKILFIGETPPVIMMSHFQPPQFPENWPDGVPDGVNDVLAIALARQADDRYTSCGELAAALKQLQNDRLAQPYSELQKAVEESRWDDAIGLADKIRAKDSNYRDLVALEKLALAKKVEAQNKQAAVQWREQAEAALKSGNSDMARMAALKWQELTGEEEAAVFLQQLVGGPLVGTQKPDISETVKPEKPSKTDVDRQNYFGLPLWGWGAGAIGLVIVIAGLAGGWFSPTTPDEATPTMTKEVVAVISQTDTPTATKTKTPEPAATNTKAPEPTATKTETPEPAATNTKAPEPTPTQTPFTNGHEWIEIPASSFLMGSAEAGVQQNSGDSNAQDDEKPQHEVDLDTYWIAQYETTNAQYKMFVDDGNKDHIPVVRDDELCHSWQEDGTYNDEDFADHPVVCINWHDAIAYTEWLSEESGVEARLPTEAEWEKAARGTEGQIYPWGNQFDSSLLNFCDVNCDQDWADKDVDDGFERTAPVGTYPQGASPYGVEDMAGNVWEWTASLWGKEDTAEFLYPYDPTDGREDLSAGDDVRRVVRGGSWNDFDVGVRSANRGWYDPVNRTDNVGFRVVASSPISQ